MVCLFSVLPLAIILSGYVVTAHLLVGANVPGNAAEAARRDTLYFSIHAGALVVALLAGFAVGKWLNGLGIAFALLFFVVLASSMSLGQIAAYQAACHGRNGIIRHWTC